MDGPENSVDERQGQQMNSNLPLPASKPDQALKCDTGRSRKEQKPKETQIEVTCCLPLLNKVQTKSVLVNLPYVTDYKDTAQVQKSTQEFLQDCTT